MALNTEDLLLFGGLGALVYFYLYPSAPAAHIDLTAPAVPIPSPNLVSAPTAPTAKAPAQTSTQAASMHITDNHVDWSVGDAVQDPVTVTVQAQSGPENTFAIERSGSYPIPAWGAQGVFTWRIRDGEGNIVLAQQVHMAPAASASGAARPQAVPALFTRSTSVAGDLLVGPPMGFQLPGGGGFVVNTYDVASQRPMVVSAPGLDASYLARIPGLRITGSEVRQGVTVYFVEPA